MPPPFIIIFFLQRHPSSAYLYLPLAAYLTDAGIVFQYNSNEIADMELGNIAVELTDAELDELGLYCETWQIDGKGFSLVEVVSTCPTNWGMTPQKALEWVESDMLPYYPLGVYKDRTAAKEEK